MGSLSQARLIHVAGRTYRSYSSLAGLHISSAERRDDVGTSYHNEEEYGVEVETEEYDLQQHGDDFIIKLHVDNIIIGFLIGAKGATKSRLEQQTGANILISSKSRDPGEVAEVTIRGATRQAVVSAANRANLLLDSALSGPRLDYTHFVSIPLASPTAQASFKTLRDEILAEPIAAGAGIEDSIFVDERKLHLTVAMLKLYTFEKRQKASQVVQRLQPRVDGILEGRPLRVSLRGLQYMNDDPSAMHVMYLGVQNAGDGTGLGALEAVCAEAVQAFDAEGLLLPKDNRDVKLHATIMNTRHRRGDGREEEQGLGAKKPLQEKRVTFDGRPVLAKFGEADFGEQRLEVLQLSQRHKVDEKTGYYFAVTQVTL